MRLPADSRAAGTPEEVQVSADLRALGIHHAALTWKVSDTKWTSDKGAAGNVSTEELVLLCEEMGIETGVDLDKLIEVGRMAETVVGHVLPSELLHAGSLDAFRRQAA